MVVSISVVRGDITAMSVDAIVNAANSRLLPGGGVCGAIHTAAGPGLAADCALIGHCDAGDAVTTDGHDLPARYVIHAVGPQWAGGSAGEEALLAQCYRSIIRESRAVAARSVAIPAISTGIYGFPLQRASEIAVATLQECLTEPDAPEVRLVAFDERTERTLLGCLN